LRSEGPDPRCHGSLAQGLREFTLEFYPINAAIM
jgi:hypothetical protein